ncbi:hydrogenase formation protein HypC [Azospirillum sp. TSH100]|uniref:HypC/HybG/HupF family hydrogenase formation chaperone n=1 Tax=Azospirillum sp. TSH100 TaxID=652764 RepID=UPI000D607AC7|nr:HypC/HybG/HupF family hydrogenase formation chaperone [Azospirillum sp. TSH100]PWC91444.1 hydrogenase formation protein HypC [Azospirillum sp. TSH100]QCG89128.1 HypC/HybG/HupF family hydrogenase formation chaperone [Azospirillum sp. TSH100]
MCLGVPARIITIADAGRMLAVAEILGESREVNLSCIAEPGSPLSNEIGQWVLVHMGFALSRVEEADAQVTLDLLRQVDEAEAGRGHLKASLLA